MQKVLSVIVPTYNMEEYLPRSLETLLVENKYSDFLEVIVVNDGSKDSSSMIAHKYSEKYPSIFRVIDKENGNYGSAINRGLSEASGKYVKILDSDDWFSTIDFSQFLGQLIKIDVDMILTNFNIVYTDTNIKKETSFPIPKNEILNFQQYKNPEVYFAMPAITYKTSLLKSFNYKQTEGISYTDTEWVFYPQHIIISFLYLPLNIYQYRMGREGQTMDNKVLLKSVSHYDKLIRAMIKFGDELSIEDKQKYSYQRLEAQITHLSMGVYRTCLVLQSTDIWSEELLTAFDTFIKERRPSIYTEATRLIINKSFPIHYVRFWRKTGHRFSVDFIRDTYRLIRYGKK